FTRELSNRHQLDGRDTQLAQALQPRNYSVERALRGKRADVQLVEHKLLARQAAPITLRPLETARQDDCRRSMYPVRLPARRGAQSINLARPKARNVPQGSLRDE